MSRILVTVLGLLLVTVMVSPQSAKAVMESTGQPNGVYCEINGVKLFAQSAEDCEKAEGSVTHTVTTTVQPADNPNEEPEIQRTKDKEPKAP
ncbi:MAG: hypothetical protein DHS20C13_04890 [Thermodesulfobacteriota bacterium]|nr:MAG: hypothetical protein DHS20C13_04890 [Thermodesulfobacteriota bacterium]